MAGSQGEPVASIPLLETKFYAPRRRPGSVARPRLLARLHQGTHSRLTLVSAPAFGAGIAGARTANPAAGRLRNVGTHVVFGLGLYLSAVVLSLS